MNLLQNPQVEEVNHEFKLFVLRSIQIADVLPRSVLSSQLIGRRFLSSCTAVGETYSAARRARSIRESQRAMLELQEKILDAIFWTELIADAQIGPQQSTRSLLAQAHQLFAATRAIMKTLERELDGQTAPAAPKAEIPSAPRLPSLRILLVEAETGEGSAVRSLFAGRHSAEFEVVHVKRLSEALSTAPSGSFDAALLDLSLPDASGLEAVDRLHEAAPNLPIVVLCHPDQVSMALQPLGEKVQDYFVKGHSDLDLLGRGIRYAIDRKKAEYLAYHDSLTELPNRRLLFERLERAIRQAQRSAKQVVAVLFLDLDNFKEINDRFGHRLGDLVLATLAKRLLGSVRETDIVSRLGGDEFIIVLTNLANILDAAKTAQKILDTVLQPVTSDDAKVSITASIGISAYPGEADDTETLIAQADSAMYRSKQRGGNSFQFHQAEMHARVLEKTTVKNSLQIALERQEFLLNYLPLVDVRYGKITGVEALIRWQHPQLGMLYPNDFLPIAEETHMIESIGEWVLRTACSMWQSTGLPSFPVSVNVSPRQLMVGDFPGMVRQTLQGTGLQPHHLTLEIPEADVTKNADVIMPVLTKLNEMKVKISFDDFGTGHVSLKNLRRFPVSNVKIDSSFIRNIASESNDSTLVIAIIEMAHTLRLNVIAEGVERAEQVDFLRQHGCDHMQGYYVGRPLPREAILTILRNEASLS